jgi:RNA polymerase sigma factor (TIGR02999 family)
VSRFNDILFKAPTMGEGDENNMEIFSSEYAQLRQLAAKYLASERSNRRLSPTSVVHEVWTHLQKTQSELPATTREDLYIVFAREMQRVLIEHARVQRRSKMLLQSELVDKQIIAGEPSYQLAQRMDVFVEGLQDVDLLDLETALARFAADHPDKAKLVHLRFFVGCSLLECAEILQIGLRTADRYWSFARAWLNRELKHPKP